MCIDEELEIFGEFDSNQAQNLMIVFDKCDPEKRDKCKSEAEINEVLQGSYIVIVENE